MLDLVRSCASVPIWPSLLSLVTSRCFSAGWPICDLAHILFSHGTSPRGVGVRPESDCVEPWTALPAAAVDREF